MSAYASADTGYERARPLGHVGGSTLPSGACRLLPVCAAPTRSKFTTSFRPKRRGTRRVAEKSVTLGCIPGYGTIHAKANTRQTPSLRIKISRRAARAYALKVYDVISTEAPRNAARSGEIRYARLYSGVWHNSRQSKHAANAKPSACVKPMVCGLTNRRICIIIPLQWDLAGIWQQS